MVNSICLAIFIEIPYDCHSGHIDSTCVQMHAILGWSFLNYLPAQTSSRTWVGSRQFKPVLIVQLSLFNLSILDQSVCFWSFVWEIILLLYLSIRLFRWFLNPMTLHSFFHWLSTDTHISSVVDRPIHCWVIIRQCHSFSITLRVLPLIHSAFGKLYPLFCQPCSTLELVLITLEACGICSYDTPMGWTYAFP
jgi:hypothetical protein